MNKLLLAVLVLGLGLAATASAAPRRTISLSDALALADQNLPTLREAIALADVAAAQADESRASLLPQLSGSGVYRRATNNFAPTPGAVPMGSTSRAPISTETFNYFSFGAQLSQTIFDAPDFTRWRSTLANTRSFRAQAEVARLDAAYNARVAFFNARAMVALVVVAKETLGNQGRHLDQVKGFVEVGTHPEIDLAQAKSDYATAKVTLINAENNADTAKAALNQAMGIVSDTEFDLGEGTADAVDLEDASIGELSGIAEKLRPELRNFEQQVRTEELILKANQLSFTPQVGLSTSVSDAGVQINNLAWNWNVQATLSWNIFSGLLTYSQVKEAQAQIKNLQAELDAQRIQVRVDLEKGRLAVRAGKATLQAAGDALDNARIREKLAEGRYQAGVGNAIELADAVLALASAGGQRIQADFNLATARAQLLRALGRR
jgi:outer membrane protein